LAGVMVLDMRLDPKQTSGSSRGRAALVGLAAYSKAAWFHELSKDHEQRDAASAHPRERQRFDLKVACTAGAEASFDTKRRQVFVVGNEAADADSLVSAYTMAMHLDNAEVQAVAVAQIPREEFHWRGDSVALFHEAGSEVKVDGSPARMCFWNEVNWTAVRMLDSRAVVLTDHNKMTPKVADVFRGRVQLIVDHHVNKKAHREADVVVVEGLGSCCTLVAEQILNGSQVLTEEMGVLLAGVIVLDTRNFDPKETKGTSRDRVALAGLAPYTTSAWFRHLWNARLDVSQLSVRDLPSLDMKVDGAEGFAGKVAFSSMMGALDSLAAKVGGGQAMLDEMRAFARAGGFAAVMGFFMVDDEGLRGMALVCATDAEQPLCDSMERRLAGAPRTLPLALRENKLFVAQGVTEHGFGPEGGLVPLLDLAPLRAFRLRGQVSRKTLLPCAVAATGPDTSVSTRPPPVPPISG